MKPANIIFDLLRTYPDKGTSVKTIMSTGLMFGFNENQMRVSLSRLVARKTLENFKRGYYRMTDVTDPINDFVERWRMGEKRRRSWIEGQWICVYVPTAQETSENNKAIWALSNNGFRVLTDNLWIRPDNLSSTGDEMASRLQLLGLPKAAVVLSSAHITESCEEVWFRFFDTAQLDKNYNEMRRQLESSMTGLQNMPIDEAKQESFHLGGEAIQLLVKDPLVPEQRHKPFSRQALWQSMIQYDQAGRQVWAHNTTVSEGAAELPNIIPTRRLIAVPGQ